MRRLLPRAAALLLLVLTVAAPATAAEPLRDVPVIWWEDDRRPIPEPAERSPNLIRDQIHTTVVRPSRRHFSPSALGRSIGSLFGAQRWPDAQNVNVLDEVANSTWFTNRIGLRPFSPEECARGPGRGEGPDRTGVWTVVSAKTEGVTPGFNIRDSRGDVYVIKFDPAGYLGTTTGPGAISARILHAAGYNVPEDVVVTFRRDMLELGEGVRIKEQGVRRPMTVADLDAILAKVEEIRPGEYLAISSKFLSGKPIGPFDYRGTRDDDPNDAIPHQHRRELRGLRVIAAWINHFDTKQHNTLDMYVEGDEGGYVKHHLIDFASTIGSGARGAHRKNGWEFGFDGLDVLKRLVTLGLVEDDWRKLKRPEGVPEVGYFDTENFSSASFEPLTPNSAFARLTDRDGYWAAKIISAFTDEGLRAIAETAKYRSDTAAPYVAKMLAARRDILAREFFTRVCPVDFFHAEAPGVVARDLGVERGLWPTDVTTYRTRAYGVREDRKPVAEVPDWTESTELPLVPFTSDGGDFFAVDYQVNRGEGWSRTVTAYVARASHRIVGVDR